MFSHYEYGIYSFGFFIERVLGLWRCSLDTPLNKIGEFVLFGSIIPTVLNNLNLLIGDSFTSLIESITLLDFLIDLELSGHERTNPAV